MRKIVAAKIPGKVRRSLWAADFNTEGDINSERKPHSWPAKDLGSGTTYSYVVYKGYYVLCGDEGKMRGVEHLYKKKDSIIRYQRCIDSCVFRKM